MVKLEFCCRPAGAARTSIPLHDVHLHVIRDSSSACGKSWARPHGQRCLSCVDLSLLALFLHDQERLNLAGVEAFGLPVEAVSELPVPTAIDARYQHGEFQLGVPTFKEDLFLDLANGVALLADGDVHDAVAGPKAPVVVKSDVIGLA